MVLSIDDLGFGVLGLDNDNATREAILHYLEEKVFDAEAGDVVVFTYSGHGTYTWDESGDEPDYYDEALVAYDGLIIDDELRAIFNKAKPGVHIAVILDSCFSGTATRMSLSSGVYKPRFMPPKIVIPKTVKRRRRVLTETDMVEILMSGASDNEYSYDAFIDDDYHGVFSYYAIKFLANGQTYSGWYDIIRHYLPSTEYPQTPQLEGSIENKYRIVFRPDEVEEPEPEPEEPQTTLHWAWWVGIIVVISLISFIMGRFVF